MARGLRGVTGDPSSPNGRRRQLISHVNLREGEKRRGVFDKKSDQNAGFRHRNPSANLCENNGTKKEFFGFGRNR